MICNAERPVRAFPYRLVSLGAVGDVQLERRDPCHVARQGSCGVKAVDHVRQHHQRQY